MGADHVGAVAPGQASGPVFDHYRHLLRPTWTCRPGWQRWEQQLPGLLACLKPGNPGMHTTDTIDFELVLSGEVIHELDDGGREGAPPRGDTVVQNGTRHHCGNQETEPAIVAVCLIGARRANK